jgi:hypothetical protein
MSERSSLQGSNEILEIPVVLRGHHLQHINSFYYYYYWYGRKKETLVQFTERLVESVIAAYSEPTYALDVLGRTPEEAERFRHQAEETIKRFVELPDDHSLELVEGVPDDICAGCAIGNHCRLLNETGAGMNNITGDRKWVDWFVAYSNAYSDNVEISIQEETADFSDSEPQTVRRIRTTVGAIRNVMPYWIP